MFFPCGPVLLSLCKIIVDGKQSLCIISVNKARLPCNLKTQHNEKHT